MFKFHKYQLGEYGNRTMRVLFSFFLCISIFANLHIWANESSSIHVFGDSHSMEFSQIPNCIVHWLGPITMHRVGRDNLNFLHLPSHGVLEGQTAIFVFGEIDVRCHIGKQRDMFSRSLQEVIDTLVSQYFNTILANRGLYHDLSCIVYSITPPTDIFFNTSFPFYGTIEERVDITRKVNQKLASLCQFFNIPFLDVYDDYANDDGILNIALSDGTVHIHPAYHQAISYKLNQILLKLKKILD